MKYERQIYIGVLVWLLLGNYVAGFIRNIVGGGILYHLAGIFSLSEMLSTVIGWVSDLMMNFWQLIPFLKI
jgi:hypothetical protein